MENMYLSISLILSNDLLVNYMILGWALLWFALFFVYYIIQVVSKRENRFVFNFVVFMIGLIAVPIFILVKFV
ncbi:hypothetical protein HX017_09345 [Myroides marinus]|uniref:hypothetical protein n=1 Tax=Myroides marinus TaxID=703342 RepID=UPI002576B479|nr:hypothetical protein [Myroides marinus]MDM1347189.1 hypothetical protein [Myroides marinus]MDM1350509.1 hypothetical protein [Myroides marinus]MDM1355026.1 hypothetical protein [Myroides marinus]MDM1357756.1 hypothetical protein [Myroides marinus]MDM1360277.1 hypothetical protein [Myroides marinus]